MPPNDRRDCAAQILWCGLALGPARLNQRLQLHPCPVRQHRSSSHWEEQNARNHNRFKREQALGRVDGFDDDEAESECDEGSEVLVRFLATERKALEALELADKVFEAGAGAIERLREEGRPVLGR